MPLPGSYARNVTIPLQETPYDGVLTCIPHAIAPIVVGSLELRAHTVIYTPEVAYTAIQLIRKVQAMVMTQCSAIDGLYRLMAAALYGTVYTEDVDGIITPAITALPPATIETESIIAHLSNLPKTVRLLENAVYGISHPGDYDAPQGILDKLDAIAAAEQADDADLEGILEAVETAAILLA